MINKKRLQALFRHSVLISGALFLVMPLWIALMSSTHSPEALFREGLQFLPGSYGYETYSQILMGSDLLSAPAWRMLLNSLILGLGFAIGKVIISMIAAYALVYFRFPLAVPLFWMIFMTLLLPLEVRIIPSYEVVAKLNLLNSYTGLIVPLIASATGTFFFRQFYRSVPAELLEAARIDGAGPLRFFIDILIPLSTTMMAAIFIIMFVAGWNQYLWPLLMTTDPEYYSIVIGIRQVFQTLNEGGTLPQFNIAFGLTVLATIPPVLVVVIFQKMFVKGLVETEK
ncbi:sn-glycerol-3-phosphate ABC transporter permease UgpE [Sansalvadorimonas verongulae]|uniref:sn-glycerol-3-phosphate ABC transporter permease UgpE n=1 Tax=Sansalvadorimonas verongulae TaxID=2172824 RepID=UPI002E378E1E|nr:sn-glycerol-3-phosphate ABC transporter permease UgpE [Sansalvadorimonas verongulae]